MRLRLWASSSNESSRPPLHSKNFLDLPPEILRRIFAQTSLEDHIACMLTCRALYALGNHEYTWRIKYIHNWPILGPIPPSYRWKGAVRDRTALEARWASGYPLVRTQLIGHSDSVYCCEITPELIFTGSRDRTVRIWDAKQLKPRHVLQAHLGSVLCLKVVDGLLVTGSSDESCRVWLVDNSDISLVASLEVGSAVLDVAAVAYDSGKWLVLCGAKDGSLSAWSINRNGSHTLLQTLRVRGPVNALVLTGDRLWTAGGDHTLREWRVGTCKGTALNLARIYRGHRRGIACLAISPRHVVSGSSDGQVRVWDLRSGVCTRVFQAHSDLVRALDIREPSLLVSGSYDGALKVWNLDTGRQVTEVTAGRVLCVRATERAVFATLAGANPVVLQY